jgi:NAD(P)-dependent dehydrogenase (short-subunit alcohol dehydrogenase family)
MTADTTVAEIEAAGGAAMGIEVDVRDHAAVEAMVARVVKEWGRSMYSSRMQAVVVVAPWIRKPAPSIRRSCAL